jgi:hypothetical protein
MFPLTGNARHLISKSSYIRSLQCHKLLFLYKFHYKLRDAVPEEKQIRFEKGHNIGRLAQQLFPGGIDVTPDQPYNYYKSVALTDDLILKGYDTVYEAAFQFDEVLAVADILVKRSGKWFAYEVKSSLTISETYLQDVALQYYVIINSGLKVERISIIHLNRALNEALVNSPAEIFTEEDVTDYCSAQLETVKKNIDQAKSILVKKQLPLIDTGEHCFRPYKCDFFAFCHRTEPIPGELF